MSNEIDELSIGDLDEVSGGLTRLPTEASITPSIPIPPPEPGSEPVRPGDFL